jgi:hypothetical protein
MQHLDVLAVVRRDSGIPVTSWYETSDGLCILLTGLFQNATWDINSLKVYKKQSFDGGALPSQNSASRDNLVVITLLSAVGLATLMLMQ